MNEAFTALLGVATGFLLPSLNSYLRSRVKGTRFENAMREELEEAKGRVHEKMIWLSRDQAPFRSQTDENLLVDFEGKLLYLGEREEFSVSLPFWENNLRDIIETTSTRSFNALCREVSLLRRFASKFREMKLAFKVGGGEPRVMAAACYRDLIRIHDELMPGKPFAVGHPEPARAAAGVSS